MVGGWGLAGWWVDTASMIDWLCVSVCMFACVWNVCDEEAWQWDKASWRVSKGKVSSTCTLPAGWWLWSCNTAVSYPYIHTHMLTINQFVCYFTQYVNIELSWLWMFALEFCTGQFWPDFAGYETQQRPEQWINFSNIFAAVYKQDLAEMLWRRESIF